MNNQPILMFAEPAATSAARLPAAARIRISLPFIFFDHLSVWVHSALLLSVPIRFAWLGGGYWLIVLPGLPRCSRLSPGTLGCQHVSP